MPTIIGYAEYAGDLGVAGVFLLSMFPMFRHYAKTIKSMGKQIEDLQSRNRTLDNEVHEMHKQLRDCYAKHDESERMVTALEARINDIEEQARS